MRRGHQGIGGWRNENHRHYRPRTGGTPRFRPPRLFSFLEVPRFPPPGPRLLRPPHPYSAHPNELVILNHHETNNYRNLGHHQNHPRLQDRHQLRPRHPYQYINPNLKQDGNTQNNSYDHPSNFYNDGQGQGELFHVNSLGDVDHRHLSNVPHGREPYNTHRVNPWADPPPNQRQLYEDSSQQIYRPHDTERHHAEVHKIPSLDYTGHRPPSSDYYGSTSSTTINNNNTAFSRSVDDTVDIVRKRLMNRNEPQTATQETTETQMNNEQDVQENLNQNNLQELPTKKRVQRQKQNVKSNCDKMKSNIVNELFKMDKDKMHKLMDDPGSSSKFEYAISSLITESQNSLNRHLRSVAEKSLVSTSSDDFIHNDNNTIYEDTFMKQMQCLLDPQDTILLEDIKPLVMAELSKVLQIDDFESRYDTDEHSAHQLREFQQSYANSDYFHYKEFPQEAYCDYDQRITTNDGPAAVEIPVDKSTVGNLKYENQEEEVHDSNQLFEQRSIKRSDQIQEQRRQSMESQRQRTSTDNLVADTLPTIEATVPLFNTNSDHFSEVEDTFAELDRQYHVAVDPTFLENLSARTTPNYTLQVEPSVVNIKQEFNNQPLIGNSGKDIREEFSVVNIKTEGIDSLDFSKDNSTPINTDNLSSRIDHISIKQEHAARSSDTVRDSEKSKNSRVSKTSLSNSRKRSIDQRPPHRKEKRKKSESHSSESTKSHRHGSTSSRDRHSKSTDKCNDLSKSYYSIFQSRHDGNSKEISKDLKRNDSSQKGYSDKYVKRKESRKSIDRDSRKKRYSSSSSQTILSPKDNSSINTCVTPSKNDPKTKLKPIDMFVEQTKKISVHHSHRNTAPTAVATPKPAEEKPIPVPPTPHKEVQTTHASTQVFKRVINKETQTFEGKAIKSRFCQTDKKNQVSVGVQTPRVFSNKPKPDTKDAFERMKEIDLEIQELLQEKFQLYNNLESKHSAPQAQAEQSYLSVTVVNVAAINQQEENNEENKVENESPSTDTIPEVQVEPGSNIEPETETDSILDSNINTDAVEDFTNIPVEELAQIALESVKSMNFNDAKSEKRSARNRALKQERMNSESPKSTSSRKSNKKAKTPNISLIEQIITDERPLEDIISLDELEEKPRKHKKKPHRTKPKKKSSKKSKLKIPIDVSSYGLKECSVVLHHVDISKHIKQTSQELEALHVQIDNIDSVKSIKESPVSWKESPISCNESPQTQQSSEPGDVIEESVVNDLQFDMLDVSEDIVIGDSCEIKDKDSSEQTHTVNEDLILDNSQSSADEVLVVGDTCHAENVCRTYDYSTDEKLRRDSLTVMGNVDAVLAIECIESNFIAACLDGNVYHFSGDGQLLNTMRGSNLAVTCLTIVKEKYETTIYTGSLDSRIRYYDLDTGLEKGPECNVLSPIQTMDRAWDTVFVGTRTGFVLQFECKNNMLIPVSTVKFSEQAILALRAMKEGPRKVLLVASRSENVTIKDAQTGLLLRTLTGPKMTVYTLLFEDGKVYCGTSSHEIHVFDYSSGAHAGVHSGGKGAVCLRAAGGLLFAGCYDGCVYVFREGDARPLAQLRGPGLMLLSLAVLGSKIIAGYKDRSLYIWKIPLSILQEMIL